MEFDRQRQKKKGQEGWGAKLPTLFVAVASKRYY
jgi:hypothetical protein